MVAAPLIAFVTTHILYLNFYKLDYGISYSSLALYPLFKMTVSNRRNRAGLNMKACVGMGMAQLLLWAGWAGFSNHPSRWKLWVVVIGGRLAML
ncbi:hypothetical protein Sjap_006776 [Stephania japonica]|uniref:Post-GPI attachment to proteins factor 3 n=1 Tax=Stephania japonica TaxID=461633 RepID=A0AAP0PJ93_9MAGN